VIHRCRALRREAREFIRIHNGIAGTVPRTSEPHRLTIELTDL